MHIREAIANEAPLLNDLQRESLGYWNRSQNLINALAKIEIPGAIYPQQLIRVLDDGQIFGFYRLEYSTTDAKLSHLYVARASIGKGLGKRLWGDAISKARISGAQILIIIADQDAKDFYLKQGATACDTEPSPCCESIFLTTLRFDL